jgi:hypothetical protein
VQYCAHEDNESLFTMSEPNGNRDRAWKGHRYDHASNAALLDLTASLDDLFVYPSSEKKFLARSVEKVDIQPISLDAALKSCGGGGVGDSKENKPADSNSQIVVESKGELTRPSRALTSKTVPEVAYLPAKKNMENLMRTGTKEIAAGIAHDLKENKGHAVDMKNLKANTAPFAVFNKITNGPNLASAMTAKASIPQKYSATSVQLEKKIESTRSKQSAGSSFSNLDGGLESLAIDRESSTSLVHTTDGIIHNGGADRTDIDAAEILLSVKESSKECSEDEVRAILGSLSLSKN